MDLSKIKDARRFSEIWMKSRSDAGVSQEFMAISLGVSKKTIQNWEKGTSSPSLKQALEWFNIIDINPCHYLLGYLYPNLYKEASGEELDDLLYKNIKSMSEVEKKQLLFLISGNHGSSWHHLLQMFTAHCHINLKSRVLTAEMIINSYEMDLETKHLYCEDDIMPDVNMLKEAINQAKTSVIKGKKSYFNVET